MKKLAFCFLIYDTIAHEDLWSLFFNNIDSDKYTIYIHHKSNKPLKYFEKYKLSNCIETKWEDETITLAYNYLFREAYKDADNYKFIILSGNCIPFKSFNFIYKALTKDNFGYFNICLPCRWYSNCLTLEKFVEKKYISKSHNWFILNRKLVENLCLDKDKLIIDQYKKIFAPCEYYYYTYIKVLGLEEEIITTLDVSNDATTFTNWGNVTSYRYKRPTYGITLYNSITEEELLYLLFSKCFFGRKFSPECSQSLQNKIYLDFIKSY